MAWRPTQYVREGELDNTVSGKVTGWIRFAGVREKVTLDLNGDFHRDIRGAKLRIKSSEPDEDPAAVKYMEGFSRRQTGKTGDITAGLPPADYVDYPYVEWYSDVNGRVVLELAPDQIEVTGVPVPSDVVAPISRAEQEQNMDKFLRDLAQDLADKQL